MIQNLVDKLESIRQKAIDEGKKFLTTDDIVEYRLGICKSCNFYFSPTGQCKKCGCFLSAKIRLARQRCPVGKWERIEFVNQQK